ncbi:hypothetical protein CANCADRAFT_27747 [Tortispora caseinolytica NRRL Y-17796]|uniref:Cytochrome b5 heme-binding domain-containing protein n=1 Tax=Tortispora caseinolytica NRRL Y-17796 TaxID=767744 RepID=A0A1E4TCG5_9ASCO|nr:hypothetical protein CANCADRAFT_27747 [Tortispora caseinolytica NRRL Y-17796]
MIFLDLARILSGVVVLLVSVSYARTGSLTWGCESRWLYPGYVMFRLFSGPRVFTDDELAFYDGRNGSRIFLALNGTVYDVSARPEMYGPGSTYSMLAARDATRAFVNGCMRDDAQLTYDLRGLDQTKAEEAIRKWKEFFDSKPRYWVVGRVEHDPAKLDSDIPPFCDQPTYF